MRIWVPAPAGTSLGHKKILVKEKLAAGKSGGLEHGLRSRGILGAVFKQ